MCHSGASTNDRPPSTRRDEERTEAPVPLKAKGFGRQLVLLQEQAIRGDLKQHGFTE